MQFIKIAGAAVLTGTGLGCLAASAVLWSMAGFDLARFPLSLPAVSD
jgi:hypothetical protein